MPHPSPNNTDSVMAMTNCCFMSDFGFLSFFVLTSFKFDLRLLRTSENIIIANTIQLNM